MGTASPVVRWREANKELVETEGDVVQMMRREIERLLHEVGLDLVVSILVVVLDEYDQYKCEICGLGGVPTRVNS